MTAQGKEEGTGSGSRGSGRSGERPPPAPGKVEARRIEKPWGYELWWAVTDRYVGKLLHVRAGEALSLQLHRVKDETIHLLSGEMRFWVGRDPGSVEEVRLGAGESFRIPPGTVHRMEAVTDCDLLEASTPHLEDVVRLEDRYGRAPGGGG